jgi:hypothetical protein
MFFHRMIMKLIIDLGFGFGGSLTWAREQDPLRLPASSGGASGVDESFFEAFEFVDSCEDLADCVAFPNVCGVFFVVSAHAAHGSARGVDPSFARDECSVNYMFEVR